jgi:hypothetical protein
MADDPTYASIGGTIIMDRLPSLPPPSMVATYVYMPMIGNTQEGEEKYDEDHDWPI